MAISWNVQRNAAKVEIISPILANIYLDKLDKYMKEYASKFDKGDRGRQQREYEVLTYQKRLVMRELKTATNNVERKVLVKRLKEIDKPIRDAVLRPYGRKLQEA